jgi:ATP-dependent Clp protease ATP-binding subunit ClpC
MYMAKKGYDPVFGARLFKRTIQRDIQDVPAGKLLGSSLRPGGRDVVDGKDGNLHSTL